MLKIFGIKIFMVLMSVELLINGSSIYGGQKPESDLLTLVFTLGEEIKDEEYFLVKPTSVVVNKNGDIIVFDENRIKVFNSEGKGIKLIGQKGQGPNEFMVTGNLQVYDDNSITATGSQKVNFYSPDLKLDESVNLISDNPYNVFLKSNDQSFRRLRDYRKINENVFVSDISSSIKWFKIREVLIYHKALVIGGTNGYSFLKRSQEYYDGRGRRIPLSGEIKWVANGEKIYYTLTDEDINIGSGKSTYSIHSMDFETQTIIEFFHEYDPLPIDKKPIDKIKNNSEYDEVKNLIDALYENTNGSVPPVKWLKLNSKFLFVGTKQKANEAENLIDVFTYESNKYLGSYISDIDFHFVTNEFVYSIITKEDEFHVIKIYKINSFDIGK